VEHEHRARSPERSVEPLRALDHRRGDVEPVGALEMRREGTRQPTEPAPEVERGAAPDRPTVALRVREHPGDLLDAGGEEPVDVPTPVASVSLSEDGPEGVDPAPVFPCSAVPVASHSGT
jgi:hypothetical protein